MLLQSKNIQSVLALISVLILSSCGQEENPIQTWETNKKEIIYHAEQSSKNAVWSIDSERQKVEVDNLGLSPLYLPNQFNIEIQPHQKNLYQLTLQMGLSPTSHPITFKRIAKYDDQQMEVCQRVMAVKSYCEDSLKNYQNQIFNDLNSDKINDIQYDRLMTNLEGTFLSFLRQELYNAQVLVTSSENLRRLLDELEATMEAKQWDEFLLFLKDKK